MIAKKIADSCYSTLALSAATLVVLAGIGFFSGEGMVREWVMQLCCYGLFAMSLNLLIGNSGMLSFGHGAFFGLSAYSFCLLMKNMDIAIPFAILVTLVLVGAVAALIGFISVRIEGIFFSFITLAIQMLIYSLVLAWSELTGGEQGLIGGVPRPVFLGVNLADPWHLYLFSVTSFVACVALIYQVVRSPFGTALRMIRDNPSRASFVGLNVIACRVLMFVIAALFAAVAGILMGLQISGAYPNFVYWTLSGEGLFMVMLGGLNQFFGPIVGSALLIVINGVLNNLGWPHGLVLGAIILFMVLGLKQGLLEFLITLWKKAGSQKASSPPSARNVVGADEAEGQK